MSDGKKLSGWLVVEGHCAMRILEGSDPGQVANRVAFIEKTPRVRVRPFTDAGTDHLAWRSGPKGRGGRLGGPNAEVSGCYGFDMDSRAWCDAELLAMGYEVPDPVSP